ncbi:MAG: hypothetical protein U0326_44325 [Polyangiales bacterium]
MRSWIFQGNPKRFRDINGYFREVMRSGRVAGWSVTKEAHQQLLEDAIGDEVWFWRSDGGKAGSGGVIAHGHVCSKLYDGSLKRPSILWVEATENPELLRAPFVEVLLTEARVEKREGMVLRSRLVGHAELSDLRILRWAQETNYLLDEHHAAALRRCWNWVERR